MDVSFESLSTEASASSALPPAAINDELDFQEVTNNAQVFENIPDVEDAPGIDEVLDDPVEDVLDNPVEDVEAEDVPIENIQDVPNDEVPASAGPVAPRRSTRTRRPPDRLLVDYRAGKIYKSAR